MTRRPTPLAAMLGTVVGVTAIVWGEIQVDNFSPIYGLGIAAAGFPVHQVWKRLTPKPSKLRAADRVL